MTQFRSLVALHVGAVVAVLFFASPSMAGLTAPSPYLSFADSPFAAGTYQYFYLEDFEDGSLNTPGVSANGGLVLPPAPLTDSVDGDDGTIDGWGTAGHSYYSAGLYSLAFTFNQGVLGSLPTCAGLVWTDVGFSDKGLGYDTVTFEAFDATNTSLGTVTLDVGDGAFNGQTAEDRFFGVTNTTGISKIVLTSHFSTDWEVDHLQYGVQTQVVPAPGALLLAAFGTALVGIRRRRA